MDPITVIKAAGILRQAQITHTPCGLLTDGLRPATLDHAYDIQDALFDCCNEPLGLLKGAITSQAGMDMFGLTEQVAGRVPASGLHRHGDELSAGLFCQAPFLECEFAVRVGPDGQADAFATAIEVAAMRYAGGSAMTGVDLIAENVAAAAVVLGEERSLGDAGDLSNHEVSLAVNGEQRATGGGANVKGGPLASFDWVVAHERSRGREPVPGTWVITGSLTGVTPIQCGDSFSADFGSLGTLSGSVGLPAS